MPSFNLVIPGAIQKAVISSPKKTTDVDSLHAYDDGFAAGYKAGMLKAELEASKLRAQTAQHLQQLLAPLSKCQSQFVQLLHQDLPELLSLTLDRVFSKNPFPQEALKNEVESMIKQLSEAKSITIECSVEDLGILQQQIENGASSSHDLQLNWKSNPDFRRGDFRIFSDLGSFDGRLHIRLSHVHEFLKETAETQTISKP